MSQAKNSYQLLTQQHEQLKSLEKIIEKEKEVLQQHDPDSLIKISNEKNDLLLAIQTLDQKISINKQFSQDKAAGKLEKELQEITNQLAHCQQQNQINGQIIQQSQLAVERMKTTLLENHNKNTITYDNKGKKSGGLSSIGLKA